MRRMFIIALMEQEETHMLCKQIIIEYNFFRSTSGGFNNIGKVVEYRQAFVASLRQYERPQSAYQKLGGMTGGLRRTASSNTFKHTQQA